MREHTCCITGQQLAPEEDIKALKERLAEVIGSFWSRMSQIFCWAAPPDLNFWREQCSWRSVCATRASRSR